MRRKDKEVTSRAWMENVLQKAQWLELGLADSDGQPYVVPLNFAYLDGRLIFHSAKQGRKAEMLAMNPKVCFQAVVDTELIRDEVNPAEFSMRYRSVTGFGVAKELRDTAEKQSVMEALMRHYDGPTEPMPDAALERTLVAEIEITGMTGKISGYPKPE